MTDDPTTRLPAAVIGIGASAGGVEALSTFLAAVSSRIDAAVFVVLHISARGPSVLPQILSRATGFRADHAIDGEPLERGRVYVAPPDRHLVLDRDVVRVVDGPKENGVRPAIDVLFRSLAASYGHGAIAVVLSGMLDDGTAGAREVKRAGGSVLVQDPHEALFPAMPANAMTFGAPDHVAGLKDLARALAEVVDERRASGRRGPVMIDDTEPTEEPSEFTCPDCGGTLFLDPKFELPHFRCRVGHAYSPESLLVGKEAALEAALWAAIVALEERADLLRRLTRRMDRSLTRLTGRYQRQTEEAERQARTIRELLTGIKLAHLDDEQGSSS